jgi:hypothetical protein
MAELGVVATAVMVAPASHPVGIVRPLVTQRGPATGEATPAARASDAPPTIPVLRVALLPASATLPGAHQVPTEPRVAAVVQLADARARRAARA